MTEKMAASLRLDKWLWFARFFKSRSLAQAVIAEGEVCLNGRVVSKNSQTLVPGDEVLFPLGRSRRRVRVSALGERRGPASEARLLYEELEPPAEGPSEDAEPVPQSAERSSWRRLE